MTTHLEYQQFKGERPTLAAAPTGKLTPTTPDIEGPFYKADAPFLPDGRLAGRHDGKPLILQGKVMDTSGNAIVGALLDFWQADANGDYDNAGFRYRGKVTADSSELGAVYTVHTIRPGDYKISDNPPDFRCAHIHVKVTADGFKPLTTQLYFEGAAHNDTDHWFDPARVIHDGQFDFVLEAQ